ncbi:MAG: hypothetical protein AB4290_23835 [Spirulina sp.]
MQTQQMHYISLEKFVKNREAIAQLDITQHPDLMELKTKIREISARSPDNQT